MLHLILHLGGKRVAELISTSQKQVYYQLEKKIWTFMCGFTLIPAVEIEKLTD